MKIIASHITNLTDARYFAAWGADYLAYDIDPDSETGISQEKFNELAGWVEGPESIVLINGLSVPESAEAFATDHNVEHVIIGPFIEKSDLPEAFTSVFRVCPTIKDVDASLFQIVQLDSTLDQIPENDLEKIKETAANSTVYLDGNFHASDLEKINALGVAGIVVRGGDEEKVGFKSFDDLDDLLGAFLDMDW